jgi:putative DNA methylase
VLLRDPVSGSLKCRTSTESRARTLAVCTDPPYYGNIGYADLSDFFYIWLRHSLSDQYPDLFGTLLTPKGDELIASPHRFDGDLKRMNSFFEGGLVRAFDCIREVEDSDYPVSVFYAFKQEESEYDEDPDKDDVTAPSTGWETMLEGLLQAGFAVCGTWPMRSEQRQRLRAYEANTLASSIVLVCRPRSGSALSVSRGEFLEELGIAMRGALPLLSSGRVAPVDLAQASIGPGMAVYSKYDAVIRQDGRKVSVREALQDINNAIAAYRSERVSSFGGETRFCMDWYQQYGYAEGAYGDADNLARDYNVGPEAMQRDGLLTAARGRVSLERPATYPVGVAGLDRPAPWWKHVGGLPAARSHAGEGR